jgi:hypothetical protein
MNNNAAVGKKNLNNGGVIDEEERQREIEMEEEFRAYNERRARENAVASLMIPPPLPLLP